MKNPLITCAMMLCLLAAGCASKKTALNNIVRDGSSFDKAIVVNETGESAGVHDEYAWIRQNYPGSRVFKQALAEHNKKPYDILYFTTADGKEMTAYFDISKFFGKF